MTSTGTFQGFGGDTRKSSKVLKPPGGGSSDIFGAPEETSPRRIKNHNASQLGSALFGEGGPKNNGVSSTGTTSPDSPRGNKPGNDSYKRLFGPPDAPSTQNTKNHPRSNISLSGESLDDSSRSKSSNASNGFSYNGTSAINGNYNTNDITGGSSCMPRNPVTGDGVDVTPLRRSARKSRDGNPVTGTGYTPDPQNNIPAPMQNGGGSVSSINGSEKSHDTSPAGSTKGQQSRARVPPGGYSSGLW